MKINKGKVKKRKHKCGLKKLNVHKNLTKIIVILNIKFFAVCNLMCLEIK